MPPAPVPAPEELLARLAPRGIRLGLEAPRHLLEVLGNPQRSLPSVLVAGSNGKGSTATLLASIVLAGGYRTGLYTSPPLESVEEVIRVDGAAIGRPRLSALLAEVLTAAEEARLAPPTSFEALTAAAFLHLARSRVELAVVEVGLGGARDVTNLLDPEVSLITSVSLEHRRWLGDTAEAIAREKAGVFRCGRPAVAWVEREPVAAVLREAAEAVGTRLLLAPAEVVSSTEPEVPWAVGARRVMLSTPAGHYGLAVPLAGDHQLHNLAMAVLAAEALRQRGWERLEDEAVSTGVAAWRSPGRLERVRLPGGRELLLDTAHNPEGAAALARFLAPAAGSFDLLFGALEDKEVEAMLPPLAAMAGRVFLTRPVGPRPAHDPAELVTWVSPERVGRVEESWELALEAALEGAGRLVVCGSIYLVGSVRRRLRERFGVPPPPI